MVDEATENTVPPKNEYGPQATDIEWFWKTYYEPGFQNLNLSNVSEDDIRNFLIDLANSALNGPSLFSAFYAYKGECDGKDNNTYPHNCAHFLSDAFIRGGYMELLQPNPLIQARCNTPAQRPIRARNMWNWFKSKAEKTSLTLPAMNTGIWAVFQLEESVFYGGHVAMYNTSEDYAKNHPEPYVGTGWYPEWKNQYFYQWGMGKIPTKLEELYTNAALDIVENFILKHGGQI